MKHLLTSIALIMLSKAGYAETLVCNFSKYHSQDENRLQTASDFGMTFRYDPITREAFMEGNNGVTGVTLTDGYDGLTFLEFLPAGAVQSTTVAKNGAAVHSRHTIMFGDLVPTQYYGTCR